MHKRLCVKISIILVAVFFVVISQGCTPVIKLRSSYDLPPVEEPQYSSIRVNKFDKADNIEMKSGWQGNKMEYEPFPTEGFSVNLADSVKKAGLAESVFYTPSEDDRKVDYVISGKVLQFSQDFDSKGLPALAMMSIIMPPLIIPYVIVVSTESFPLESNIEVQVQLQDVETNKILLNNVYKKHENKKINHWNPPGKWESHINALMGSLIEEIINDLKILGRNLHEETAMVP